MLTRTLALALFLGAPPALLGAQQQPGEDSARDIPLDRVVAVVGQQPILWSSVVEFVNQQRARGLEMPPDSAGQLLLFREAVNDLIDEEVLVQRARVDSIVVLDSDIRQQVDAQIQQVRSRFSTDAEYRQALRENGLGTPEEYRRSITEQIRRVAMQQQVIAKLRQSGKILPAAVSEAEISEAFERHRASFPRRPATVGLRQIVVSPTASAAAKAMARAKAESLLVELRRGADFGQVARRESMDPGSRETGGDLGWNRRGVMVPEFERWMFALAPGQLSPVVETVYGFHIIQVERAQPAEVKARHILIRPVIDSADVARARSRADSVSLLWRAGSSFDSLVTAFHDPGEDRIIPSPYPRDSLPASYREAIAGTPVRGITEPFPIPYPGTDAQKFVVVQVTEATEGGEYTVADLRERLRRQLAEERAIRRLLDSLRRETYVAIRL